MAKKKPQEPTFTPSEVEQQKAEDKSLAEAAAKEKMQQMENKHESSLNKTDLEKHPKFDKFKR